MFGLFVRRGAFDPPPDRGRVGVACLLPVNTSTKMTPPRKYWRHGHYVPPAEPPPNLPWSGRGIAVLFRRHEPYADLRNLVVGKRGQKLN